MKFLCRGGLGIGALIMEALCRGALIMEALCMKTRYGSSV